MKDNHTYGIIGAGAIGQALGSVLRRANREVVFWDIEESKCTVDSPQELVRNSDVVILAIPSQAVRQSLQKIKADVDQDKVVLTVAKGVEKGFKTMAVVLEEELSDSVTFGIISGPMLAGELMANEGGYGVVASTAKLTTIINDCKAGGLTLTESSELVGVATCGVLKNIYALALGVSDGVDLGINTKAALTADALKEMAAILHQLQLPTGLAYEHCGLGDLLATGWGEASYNHRIGEEIGSGIRSNLSGEGLNALMEIPHVIEIADFPIVSGLHHIIVNRAPAEELGDIVT